MSRWQVSAWVVKSRVSSRLREVKQGLNKHDWEELNDGN
jgi:hypothetical protein